MYLQNASKWHTQSKYYIEASIAYWHTIKRDTTEKWVHILQLYNYLLQIEYSPIAALNRTYALAKARSYEAALPAAEKLNLEGNHFYYMLLAELYSHSDPANAQAYLQKALATAQTESQQKVIKRKLQVYQTG